jgi:hypothetical protein
MLASTVQFSTTNPTRPRHEPHRPRTRRTDGRASGMRSREPR